MLGVQGVNSMSHPDYQGMFVALFKACMELAAAKGVEAGYGFPSER